MMRNYKRTNLFIIDEELYDWAQYRAKRLGYRSVSEYLFMLVGVDRKEGIVKAKE